MYVAFRNSTYGQFSRVYSVAEFPIPWNSGILVFINFEFGQIIFSTCSGRSQGRGWAIILIVVVVVGGTR